MRNHQRLVDTIRAILYSDTDPPSDELARLVREYGTVCNDVNQWLREYDELLHQGLRDEAIQRCNATKLLDQVAILDFPEREEWIEYVGNCGLPAPPDIEIDRAADLNEAYAAQQPLEPLMRLHRLHALARSPLPTRIAILRRIAKQDPENAIWPASVQTFERARHEQLTEQVRQAIQRDEIQTLASLEQELRSRDWSTAPPRTLVKAAIEGHTRLRQKRACGELDHLQRELNDAYADFDVEKGRRVRGRWHAAAKIADLNGEDRSLTELVEPALEWLKQVDGDESERQQYARNLAALRQAIAEWSPYEQLKTLAEAVSRSEAGIPAVEQAQLADRFAYFEEASRRKHYWKLAAAVTSVLFLAGLTAAGIVLHLRGKERTQAVESLEGLIVDGNHQGALALVESIETKDPSLLEDSRVQKLRQDLDSAIQKEKDRRQRFDGYIAEARPIGTEFPDWDAFDKSREALSQAKEIAASDAELATIEDVSRQVREAERQKQKAEDDRFEQDFDALAGQLRNLDSLDLPHLEQTKGELVRLTARSRVSPPLLQTAKDLVARANGRVRLLLDEQRQETHFAEITQSIGNRKQYESLLETYQKDPAFRTNETSVAFERVLKNDPHIWDGVEAWSQFISEIASQDLSQLSPEQAARLIDTSQKLISDHPSFPSEPALKDLIDYLEAIAGRIVDGKRIDAIVQEVLVSETVANVYLVKTKDHKWYYSNRKPVQTPNGLQFLYFKDLALNTVGNIIKNKDIEQKPLWEAPQSAFSEEAIELYDSIDLYTKGNWEPVYQQMIRRLLEDNEMDPIFRFFLLQKILKPAMQGSQCLQVAFSKHAKILEMNQVNANLNHLNPGDDSDQVRKAATDILKRLPELAAAEKAVKAELEKLKHPQIGKQFRWLGWLRRDHEGDWLCAVPRNIPAKQSESGGLFVAFADSPVGPPKIESIGQIVDGKIQLDTRYQTGFLLGRLVYVVSDAP